jgi:hypothetical protein
LDILNIFHIFVSETKEITMVQTRKYKIGCSGSGWGVWEISTGCKVASCGLSRYSALDKWYELEGWRKPAMWK